ncbi:MAG: alpha/beta hydrolase [Acidimicrobiia bacterium]|nr:alpha/beta hydrolase [Acidimicrobiia bacterium]
MKVRNGSLELHVAEDGDPSAPPILLMHGITMSGGTWEWLVPTLAERFRVLRLDFRGHGASDRAPGEYFPGGYVSDAVAAIEQAAGRPCIVMGHSLGGATAAALAQQHPDLVVAAVMEDPPLGLAGNPNVDAVEEAGGPGDETMLEGNSLLESFRVIRESAPRLQASGITTDVLEGILAAAPTASGGTFGELLHPDGIASMAGALLTLDASVLDPVLTGTISSFLDPEAPFQVPSLIVCADPSKPDAVADPALAQHFASISPATEFVVLDGAGHLIHDERASRNEFRSVAVEFIDRATSAPS